jgi:hypothetical protein
MSPVPSWLRRDALNRAWRTILQTLVLVVIAPAADAAVQVAQRAIVEGMLSGTVDWDRVGQTALYAAASGVALSILSYIHRAKVDQTAILSAPPPEPMRRPVA